MSTEQRIVRLEKLVSDMTALLALQATEIERLRMDLDSVQTDFAVASLTPWPGRT